MYTYCVPVQNEIDKIIGISCWHVSQTADLLVE